MYWVRLQNEHVYLASIVLRACQGVGHGIAARRSTLLVLDEFRYLVAPRGCERATERQTCRASPVVYARIL